MDEHDERQRHISSRISRRSVLGGALGAGASLWLAAISGCQSTSSTPTAAPASGASATAAGEPTQQPAATAVPSTGSAEIELGSYFDSGPRLNFTKTILDKFHQDNPTITVKFQPVPSAQYRDKMHIRFASGTAPDLYLGTGLDFLNYAEQGEWRAVDTYIQRDKINLDGYYKQPSIFTYQGKQYGLPFMENCTIFVYNKTMFKNAGVEPPTDQWTWDNLLDAAKKLTKPGQYGLVIGDGFEFNWWTFLWSHGGDTISNDFKKTTLETKQAIEAFQWLVDLKLKHKVSPAEGDTTLGTGDAFMTNKVAMMSAGTGAVGNWTAGIKDFEWDLFYVPADPQTGQRACSSNGNPYIMTKDTKDPDAAWLLLKHLADPFTQRLIGETKIAIPTLISVATDPNSYMKGPPTSLKYTDMDMKVSRDDEFHKLWQDWYNEITKQMLLAFSGEKTVEDAAKVADQAGDRILAKE